MRLLLDANLSWRMVSILKQYFEDCIHVEKSELEIPATDIQIWNYAARNNFIIVTNDEDFVDFAQVKGFPPKVVILRTRNRSSLFISNLLVQRKSDIQLFHNSKDVGLLEIIAL
jgi:predicted nuclease of predicted toxin-antitoxin system